MLMKIGDITSKLGISHRSLHYWEDIGIIKSSRADNEYRYYDEENQQKIRQIIVLRKLRIPLNYTSKPVDFGDWKNFVGWLNGSEDFEHDRCRAYESISKKPDTRACSGWGFLEEHINSYNFYGLKNRKHILTHIDFLIPIKERVNENE